MLAATSQPYSLSSRLWLAVKCQGPFSKKTASSLEQPGPPGGRVGEFGVGLFWTSGDIAGYYLYYLYTCIYVNVSIALLIKSALCRWLRVSSSPLLITLQEPRQAPLSKPASSPTNKGSRTRHPDDQRRILGVGPRLKVEEEHVTVHRPVFKRGCEREWVSTTKRSAAHDSSTGAINKIDLKPHPCTNIRELNLQMHSPCHGPRPILPINLFKSK